MSIFGFLEPFRRRAHLDECTFDLDLEDSPKGWISWLGTPAGYVDVATELDAAELIDIYIQPRFPHWHPILRRLGLKVSFRGRGLGTILLEETLSRLRDAGVRRVRGKMTGDAQRLVPWYRSMGFNVNSDTGEIWRDYGDPNPEPEGETAAP